LYLNWSNLGTHTRQKPGQADEQLKKKEEGWLVRARATERDAPCTGQVEIPAVEGN